MNTDNPVALELELAIKTAPYQIEKDRYAKAAQEIRRLQERLNQYEPPDDTEHSELKTYPGMIWHADESDTCVRIFREHYQIIKAPKCCTPFEEYWPNPEQLTWMIQVLNEAEINAK